MDNGVGAVVHLTLVLPSLLVQPLSAVGRGVRGLHEQGTSHRAVGTSRRSVREREVRPAHGVAAVAMNAL